MPKVSVIVPVYNVKNYLEQCLDSILNQTLKDIEIICIDDGSKDECPAILDKYAQKDSRIKVIHKQNGGYGSAMNVGLKHATGEYIGIVEPDDYIKPAMYEDLYKIASENDTDIVKSCFYKKMDNKKDKKSYKIRFKNKTRNIPDEIFSIKDCAWFLYFHPSIWTCLYKRSFINDNNINFVEAPGAGWTDNPFQVQTMCLAKKIMYTNKAYYYWRCVNLSESDDLKDYTLPFKRSDEIHAWLNKEGITDPNILEKLYMREFAYIGIVLNKKNVLKNEDCIKRIIEMCNRMNSDIIHNSKFIRKSWKIFHHYYNRNINFALFIWNIVNIRKRLFSFRITRHEFSLRIWSLQIFRFTFEKTEDEDFDEDEDE